MINIEKLRRQAKVLGFILVKATRIEPVGVSQAINMQFLQDADYLDRLEARAAENMATFLVRNNIVSNTRIMTPNSPWDEMLRSEMTIILPEPTDTSKLN